MGLVWRQREYKVVRWYAHGTTKTKGKLFTAISWGLREKDQNEMGNPEYIQLVDLQYKCLCTCNSTFN